MRGRKITYEPLKSFPCVPVRHDFVECIGSQNANKLQYQVLRLQSGVVMVRKGPLLVDHFKRMQGEIPDVRKVLSCTVLFDEKGDACKKLVENVYGC